jgi:hypothetical protein
LEMLTKLVHMLFWQWHVSRNFNSCIQVRLLCRRGLLSCLPPCDSEILEFRWWSSLNYRACS